MNKKEALGFMLLACRDLYDCVDSRTLAKLVARMEIRLDENTAEEAGKLTDDFLKNNHTIFNERKNEELSLDEEFQTLWMMYPRRLGKLNAYKSYVKARKRGISYEQIETGVKDYVHYIDENKMDISFVKHGSSWFQNHCWEDDYL